MRYLVFLLLAGCCNLCPPKVIYVAAECPAPAQLPVTPTYATEDLADKATSKEVIEAYVLDFEACDSHAEQLENLLNAYGAAYKEYKIRYPAPPN